jgi:hypothetical protein
VHLPTPVGPPIIAIDPRAITYAELVRRKRSSPRRRRPQAGQPDPLAAYRRLRKPMPPPERVQPDERDKAEREATAREVEDELTELAPDAGRLGGGRRP